MVKNNTDNGIVKPVPYNNNINIPSVLPAPHSTHSSNNQFNSYSNGRPASLIDHHLVNYKNTTLNNNTNMNKDERERLFNEAQAKYAEGHKKESAIMFMKCLVELDVSTAFPSLPKCLRSLANHFLEHEEYVKSIHFVQAERLYYESALLDIAALQKKLTEMSGGLVLDQNENGSYITGCTNSSANEKRPILSNSKIDPYEECRSEIKKAVDSKRTFNEIKNISTNSNDNCLSQRKRGNDFITTTNDNKAIDAHKMHIQGLSTKKLCNMPEKQPKYSQSTVRQKLFRIANAMKLRKENVFNMIIYMAGAFIGCIITFILFSILFTVLFGRLSDEEYTSANQKKFHFRQYTRRKAPNKPCFPVYRWLLSGVQSVQVVIFSITNLFWRISRYLFWLVGLIPQDPQEIDINEFHSRPVWLK